jgi:NAD(P)-dependent dehydrogenase (short-subunit alcohol dehydrogenase family)
MNERSLHAVLGTGPLGLAVARYLATRGDRVRAANRDGRADLPNGVEVVGGDVAKASDAKRACDGAAVVYHCANPPYAKWPELHPPLMDAIIEAAAAPGRGSCSATTSTPMARWTGHSRKTCPTWQGDRPGLGSPRP